MSRPVRIGALQFDVVDGAWETNLERVDAGLEEAARTGLQLVVLPEMWPTSFTAEVTDEVLDASDRCLERLARRSAELGLVVSGSAYARTNGLPANRLHVFDRGTPCSTYDKVHLFSPTAENATFSAGERGPETVATGAGRVAGLVCYDLRFPEVARCAFRSGAELLLVSAQWPTPRASHWRALVPGRAVESQCFVVACNRIGRAYIGRRRMELDFPGNSLIASPHGEVIAEGQGQRGLVWTDVDLDEVRRVRTRIPIRRDERPELYADWIRGARARE